MLKKILLSLLIFTIALLIRMYKIDSLPSGILPDEASFGYNAYSILKTSKDEHQKTLPLVFKAFGDEKLPAQIYLLVPSIKIFGLNNFAIRVPSAMIGSLIGVIIFLLLLELKLPLLISFIGATITITSQWSIILSRFAYESNLGLLFFLIGILFCIKHYYNKKLIYIILSGLSFGLTWYSYISYRLITSLVIIGLFILYQPKKIKFIFNKYLVILIVSFFITIIPLVKHIFSFDGIARFKQTTSTAQTGMILNINENRTFCTQTFPRILCYLNSNKLVSITKDYLFRYINTFSINYLFLTGDNTSKYINIDDYGLLPIVSLPFFIVGIFYLIDLIKNKKISKLQLFIIYSLVATSVPSILVGAQKIRLSALLPFLVILISYGIYATYIFIKKQLLKQAFTFGLLIILFINLLFMMTSYLTVHIQKYETAYGTYIPKLMKYLYENHHNKHIYIKSIAEGIILYSYINQVDPSSFQKNIIRQLPDSIGFVHATDLDNLHITSKSIEEIYCLSKKNNQSSLYVTNENFIKTGKVEKAERIIMSENNVDTLVLIYDLSNIKLSVDCNSISF